MDIKIDMPSAKKLIEKKGLGRDGDVQRFHTNNVNRRIGKYMPHLTGTLETKLKHISASDEITVLGPYAQYQYYGKVMVGPPPKVVTDRDLVYTKTFNPLAGPFWDRRLVAAEGEQMRDDLGWYIKRREHEQP